MLSPRQIQFEPYKIKMVEALQVANPLSLDARNTRETALKEAYYNLFNIPAELVTIDLLTDSGTGSMSDQQWSSMFIGDESYAQATSFKRFEKSIKSIIGNDFNIIPTHQGRAAENILFYILNHIADDFYYVNNKRRRRVLINSFFDTTAANVMLHGRIMPKEWEMIEGLTKDRKTIRQIEAKLRRDALILPNQLVVDQNHPEKFEHGIFGGNINLDKFESFLSKPELRSEIMLIMLTTTNNTGGGLPVSLNNIKSVKEMIDHYCKDEEPLADGLPPMLFFLDACRFAENAYYIQQHEPNQANKSVKEIAAEMFSYVDGCTMSAKKDGMANIGGFLAVRNELLRQRSFEYMVEIEGFYTYGGLAGRDLDALAVGMQEGVNDSRVAHRVKQVHSLWKMLNDEGVPVKSPCGGHGVFLLGRAFWNKNNPNPIPAENLPGQLLSVELFRRYGIRACEIGTVMFGDVSPTTGKVCQVAPDEDYVRLAIPRRTYTDKHLEYVAASLVELFQNRQDVSYSGMAFEWRSPTLPHFLSKFKMI